MHEHNLFYVTCFLFNMIGSNKNIISCNLFVNKTKSQCTCKVNDTNASEYFLSNTLVTSILDIFMNENCGFHECPQLMWCGTYYN